MLTVQSVQLHQGPEAVRGPCRKAIFCRFTIVGGPYDAQLPVIVIARLYIPLLRVSRRGRFPGRSGVGLALSVYLHACFYERVSRDAVSVVVWAFRSAGRRVPLSCGRRVLTPRSLGIVPTGCLFPHLSHPRPAPRARRTQHVGALDGGGHHTV